MKFLIPGVASAVVGVVLAVAVVLTGTNLAQQDSRPQTATVANPDEAIGGQPEYGRR